MKIGILKADKVRHELSDHFGEYPAMFENLLREVEADIEIVIYDVISGEYPKQMDEVQGYIITGSKMSVYDEIDWIKQLGEFVQELHKKKKKLIGICFGHQAIAQALGGEVVKWPGGWGVGVRPTQFERQPVPKAELPDDAVVKLIYFHQDQVTRLPEGAERLASSDFCDEAGFTLCTTDGVQTVLCLQGHPEFDAGYSTALLDSIESKIGTDRTKAARASLAKKTDTPLVAGWIKQFFITSAQRRGGAA